MQRTQNSQKAEISSREDERLEALHASNILDSHPEESYDAITLRAKDTFNVPVALISLIDKNRQWFKSACGIDTKETDRDIAFCSYSILSEEVMVVLDATKDARFRDNPLVTGEMHIRFYAGAPIIVPDGLMLGTLCIVDTKPRDAFTQQEKRLLAMMAKEVSQLIQEKASKPLA